MKKFEVGHIYGAFDPSLAPITILKRTAQFITVRNNYGMEWRMKIRSCTGKNGCRFEYAIDSSAGRSWADAFTFSAIHEESPNR